MRKSPIRHHVRKHIRKHRPVRDYERGHGSRPNIAKPRLRHNDTQTATDFIVQITYVKSPGETLQVNAGSYPDAIENALMIRRSIEPPWSVDAKKLK